MKRILLYSFAAIGALFICVIIFALTSDTNPPPPATAQPQSLAPQQATAAPTETPLPPVPTSAITPTSLPAIGADVVAGPIRWKILSAENLGNELKSDNQFIESKWTAGKFIKIAFEVENRNSDAETYSHFDLVDSQGRTFAPYSDMFFFIPDAERCSAIETLNPNISRLCTVIFEVAADASGLRAYVGDLNMFSTHEAYIDLGF